MGFVTRHSVQVQERLNYHTHGLWSADLPAVGRYLYVWLLARSSHLLHKMILSHPDLRFILDSKGERSKSRDPKMSGGYIHVAYSPADHPPWSLFRPWCHLLARNIQIGVDIEVFYCLSDGLKICDWIFMARKAFDVSLLRSPSVISVDILYL